MCGVNHTPFNGYTTHHPRFHLGLDVHSAAGDISLAPHTQGLQAHRSTAGTAAGCLSVYTPGGGEFSLGVTLADYHKKIRQGRGL